MKKRVAILMLAATFIFTGGQTWAAGQNAGAYYVDADGDGICDHRQSDTACAGRIADCMGAGCLRYTCDGTGGGYGRGHHSSGHHGGCRNI